MCVSVGDAAGREVDAVAAQQRVTLGPLEWWYETGPDPVYAAASDTEETAFVRVLVLPAEWAGKRTIRYLDPADEEKPKLQRARIYLEWPL